MTNRLATGAGGINTVDRKKGIVIDWDSEESVPSSAMPLAEVVIRVPTEKSTGPINAVQADVRRFAL
jgi:hypothetical protein